jgi:MoaA/NifB/PqqE/SkfB family radical SAM enzyme
LLHRDLDYLLKKAKSLGFITTVTTNTLLYPKNAEKLKGLIDMLHFSLDSADPEVHDQSRGVKCFDQLLESIDIARSLGERPDILFTCTSTNLEEIEQIYHEITEPNKLVLILNPVFEYNDIQAEDNFSPGQLDELSRWGRQKRVYLNEGFVQLRKDGGNHITDPVCRAASSSIVISPFNELVLPCYHLGMENIPIENNLYELYNSDQVRQSIAMEGRYQACEGCTINCYMQPSFAVEINAYWWKAIRSTLKYNWIKGTWKELI